MTYKTEVNKYKHHLFATVPVVTYKTEVYDYNYDYNYNNKHHLFENVPVATVYSAATFIGSSCS